MLPMVDRSARDRLADAVEAFLAEDLGAFEFDDRINEIAVGTDDETVKEVAHLLWYHYDDCRDHTAALSRTEWDSIQRLLLVLRSGAVLATDRGFQWGWRQAVAIAAMVAFVGGLVLLGFGWQLLLVMVPLGGVSMLLAHFAEAGARSCKDGELVRLAPYSSVGEMLAAHRTVRAFRKRRYPDAMRERRIRGPVEAGLLWLFFRVMWLVFSPVVLLFQALPSPRSTSRVVPV